MNLLKNLFRTKREKEVAQRPAIEEATAEAKDDGYLPFEQFQAVELRVGTVKEAVPVKGSEKMLNLTVDLGEEKPRQILSGIAKRYAPEDLVGNQYVFVANLAPRKMMGLESFGMICAADNEDGAVLMSPVAPVKPGSLLH